MRPETLTRSSRASGRRGWPGRPGWARPPRSPRPVDEMSGASSGGRAPDGPARVAYQSPRAYPGGTSAPWPDRAGRRATRPSGDHLPGTCRATMCDVARGVPGSTTSRPRPPSTPRYAAPPVAEPAHDASPDTWRSPLEMRLGGVLANGGAHAPPEVRSPEPAWANSVSSGTPARNRLPRAHASRRTASRAPRPRSSYPIASSLAAGPARRRSAKAQRDCARETCGKRRGSSSGRRLSHGHRGTSISGRQDRGESPVRAGR